MHQASRIQAVGNFEKNLFKPMNNAFVETMENVKNRTQSYLLIDEVNTEEFKKLVRKPMQL